MPTDHIDEAPRCARQEPIEDEATPCRGEAPELPGARASGRTSEGCGREPKEVIEGRVLVGVRRSAGPAATG